MQIADIEARKSQIAQEIEKDGADLDALEAEVRELNAELETRAAIAAQEAETRQAIADAKEIKVKEERGSNMENIEIRNSEAYINAYANYIKTDDAAECRSLLTENVSGTVPIPELVEDIVRHAWNKEGVMALVKKAYIKGNLKVGFEISSSDAVAHTEGGDPVTEESLVLGVVELVPQSIKKWISVSDEVMDLRGEAFIRYIYEELAYRIAKKAADTLVGKIKARGTASTTTAVGVAAITSTTVTVDLIAKALGNLCDEASNPVVIMNKLTWAEFKKVQYANGYGVDPFEGLNVVFNDSLTAFSAATTGVTYAIVGDLGNGALAVLPNGDGISFKVDDKTDMAKDLVRILGRQYVGLDIVGPGCFCNIQH